MLLNAKVESLAKRMSISILNPFCQGPWTSLTISRVKVGER